MAKKNGTNSRFPTMGTGVVDAGSVNASGAASANTKRGGGMESNAGGAGASATANHRQATLERHGAQFHISATLYAPNEPAELTAQRRVIVPSAVGNRDFWMARAASQR